MLVTSSDAVESCLTLPLWQATRVNETATEHKNEPSGRSRVFEISIIIRFPIRYLNAYLLMPKTINNIAK